MGSREPVIPAGSELQTAVRAKYAAAAEQVTAGADATCAPGLGACCDGHGDAVTSNLYGEDEKSGLPTGAVLASLGCGNPTALADLREGDTVLDLGSGGGIDVLLSARRVGPTGMAYGLDMTDEMLELARRNQREAGVANVEFLKGTIEAIPLPEASVDVLISNCVINLSGDKAAVLREAYRVLKPGGRFAVSDVVVQGEIPGEVRRSMELWVGCIAGALEEQEFRQLLAEVGFESITIEPTRVYSYEDAQGFLRSAGLDVERLTERIEGRIVSAFIRAEKPSLGPDPVSRQKGEKSCCGPDCCP